MSQFFPIINDMSMDFNNTKLNNFNNLTVRII